MEVAAAEGLETATTSGPVPEELRSGTAAEGGVGSVGDCGRANTLDGGAIDRATSQVGEDASCALAFSVGAGDSQPWA